MTDATAHPRGLNLPRSDDGLATTPKATRRMHQLLPTVLSDLVADASADGVVIALEGSVDSTVAAALAVDAVGAENVTALVLPARLSDEATARDAEAVAAALGVEYRRLQIQPLLRAFQEVLGGSGEPADDLVATANALDRLRMACTYYVADTTNALVVGDVNKTRRLVGPVTKHGDTAVDCFLLGDLYRTEVDALARRLEVPADIRERTTGGRDGIPGPYADRPDVAPRTVDRILRLFVDERRDPSAIVADLGVDPDAVSWVADRCAGTRRIRHMPPKPSTTR